VQVTVEVPLVAETVMTSPVVAPGMVISGVVSFVMLSEFDRPVSEVGVRSGVERLGGEVVILTARDCVVPVLPAASVTVAEMFHVPSESVASVQLLADPTVYEQEIVLEPFVALMVMTSPTV
jgi:hypothetical protein